MKMNDIIKNSDGDFGTASHVVIHKIGDGSNMQMMIKDWQYLLGLSTVERNLLSECVDRSTYCDLSRSLNTGNTVHVDKIFRREVCNKYHMAYGTIGTALSSLVAKGMLIKHDFVNGIYFLNPDKFISGNITDKTKGISKIEYWILDEDDIK